MSVADAVTARGMSQRIDRALPGIQQNFFNQNALLKIIQQKGNIKWKGSHTEFDWYIRKEPASSDNPDWGGGELGIRTFEEVDPANKATLPYCWLEKTYGVSDKTLEANRHSMGRQKIYDSLKENLNIAKISLYNTYGPSIYTGSGTSNQPTGIIKALGSPLETSSSGAVTAGQTYAGRTLNTSAITTYQPEKAGWDDPQFAPEVIGLHEVPGVSSSPKWTADCLIALAYMADEMAVTADISGTGEQQKPDLAIMNRDPFNALKAKLIGHQQYSIPVGNPELLLAGWANIQVDTLTCIKDNNVTDDSNTTALERVIILDSKQLHIATTHTKKEGLIINEFEADNPLVSGAYGVLRMNLAFILSSPTAIGCIVGCND